ncbi:MAG TPA: hypothetical protein PLW65_29310 [Pseudomonadota bacterium]|nr:hypothetical protein [Pseudomonadota bacterium]
MDDETLDFDELAAELLKALLHNPHETATQTPGQLVAKAYAIAAEFGGRRAPDKPAEPEPPRVAPEPAQKKPAPSVSKS